MAIALKLIAGAAAGALGGFLLSRVRVCGATECRSRANPIYSTLAGAVFGAGVMWWLIHR
jgi:hypothetical protein